MRRLSEMTNSELVEEARRRAEIAREHDRQLGELLDGLLESVGEMGRRLDEHGG